MLLNKKINIHNDITINRTLKNMECNFKLLNAPIDNAVTFKIIPRLNIDTLEKKLSNKLNTTGGYVVFRFITNSNSNNSEENDAIPNNKSHV